MRDNELRPIEQVNLPAPSPFEMSDEEGRSVHPADRPNYEPPDLTGLGIGFLETLLNQYLALGDIDRAMATVAGITRVSREDGDRARRLVNANQREMGRRQVYELPDELVRRGPFPNGLRRGGDPVTQMPSAPIGSIDGDEVVEEFEPYQPEPQSLPPRVMQPQPAPPRVLPQDILTIPEGALVPLSDLDRGDLFEFQGNPNIGGLHVVLDGRLSLERSLVMRTRDEEFLTILRTLPIYYRGTSVVQITVTGQFTGRLESTQQETPVRQEPPARAIDL